MIFGLLFLFLYLSIPVVICKIINLIGLSVPKNDHLQDLILVMWKKMKETEHLYGSISFLLAISFLIYIPTFTSESIMRVGIFNYFSNIIIRNKLFDE